MTKEQSEPTTDLVVTREQSEQIARKAWEADRLWIETIGEIDVSVCMDCNGLHTLVKARWKDKSDAPWSQYLESELEREIEEAVCRVMVTRTTLHSRLVKVLSGVKRASVRRTKS